MIETNKEELEKIVKEMEVVVAKEVVTEMKKDELERNIIAIQRSTKVNFPPLAQLHNFFRTKSSWYYSWHLKSYAGFVHVILLLIYLAILASIFFQLFRR